MERISADKSARHPRHDNASKKLERSILKALHVLFEDNHLLVINKRAGIATMGTAAGQPSVAREAAAYLKRKYNKPGNVFVGVVSRLDRLVSGVLVLARTSKAASRLSEQIRERSPKERVLGVGRGCPTGSTQQWLRFDDWVAKDESRQRMRVVAEKYPGALSASLRVRSFGWERRRLARQIELLTGRKHQIRLQLGGRGYPILGDRKYDSQHAFPAGIGLTVLEWSSGTRQNRSC